MYKYMDMCMYMSTVLYMYMYMYELRTRELRHPPHGAFHCPRAAE